MSNPTVFELNKCKIRDNVFCIEDNIGEAIHFHIGLVRFDLSVEEFSNISSTLLSILNEQVAIDGFDLSKQDEYFLERIASSIPYISAVEEDIVEISELKYRYENARGEMEEAFVRNTPVYQYYLGNEDIINDYEFKTEIWQTKEEMLEYIKGNSAESIYVDEDNYILDGYKRICARLAKGEMSLEVKVKRLITPEDKRPKYILKREKKKW